MQANLSCAADIASEEAYRQRWMRDRLSLMGDLFQKGIVVSGRIRPAMVLTVVFVLVVLVLAALALYAFAKQREVVSWKGTISSAAVVESAARVDEPVQVFVSSSTYNNQSETLAELNRYWLERVNALRRERQLPILLSDQRLIATAGEWAAEMERRGEITHDRVDGKTMHQWIDTKQIDFTERNAENGWKRNYFVENIARFYAEPSIDGLRVALDKILVDFLDEGPGGAHYESIYHLDWNSVGLGYAVHSVAGEPPRIYFTFHYGSLKPVQP
jgi:uncharacterized protein YkwD